MRDVEPAATIPGPVRPGDLVANRFEVLVRAGAGGMGVVYRARDRLTDASVAIKVLHDPDPDRDARFTRETRVLATLAHPAIVSYVAHGTTEHGEPFLAMEWLEGEDLAQRLSREGLELHDTVRLARRIAEGLRAAHAQGALHRDVKPSNVFLVGRDPASAKLLDFGIARTSHATRAVTGTGAMVGSIGYMAPEQVRGERDIDVRADVYALGCVLFECLTGRPVFVGNHPVSMLVQALHENAPSVSEIRPEVPSDFAALVDRMLSKSRDARPRNLDEVLAALDALGPITRGPVLRAPKRKVVSTGERRVVSVVLVQLPHLPVATEDRATVGSDEHARFLEPLRACVEPLGGTVVVLPRGTALVLLRGRPNAKDEAAQAAACALAIHAVIPDVRVALATGPAEVSGRWAAGPVVDRASSLLDETLERNVGNPTGVRIDEVTASLLDGRFSVHGRMLTGARAFAGESRRLLGKPTPCVGREREMAYLESTFASCVAEREARAVVLVAPAGIGKSRLRRELVARITARDEPVTVLTSRCDPLYAGSPLHAAAQLVRMAAEIHEDATHEQRHAALRAHVDAVIPAPERARALDFLGELAHAPAPGDPSPPLRAARNDPRIMAEQTRLAFEEWMRALCTRTPLVIVIEDLHWADVPSVALIERALARLESEPLFVLGLARPEWRDALPRLLTQAAEMPIEALTKRAAERLVRALLGEQIEQTTVRRIVERAGGNAFYLEELIRHVAEHGDESMPESVLGMVQSRVDQLDASARLVLRAGSVYGESFWAGGVGALIGEAMAEPELHAWLETLVRLEVIEHGRNEKFASEREHVFRHALVRDVAYAMLVEGDRALGHRLAAAWLERAGERDPQVLAQHHLRGGEPAKAAPYLLAAAEASLRAGNLDGAIALADKGLACDPTGALRARLLVTKGTPLGWRAAWDAATPLATEAMELLEPGSPEWSQSAGIVILASAAAGNPGKMFELMHAIQRIEPAPTGPYAFTVFMLATAFAQLGQRAIATALDDKLAIASAADAARDPAFRGWREIVRTVVADKPRTDALADAVRAARGAMDAMSEANDLLGLGVAGGWYARVLSLAGDQDAALEQARATMDLIDRTDNRFTRHRAVGTLGSILVLRGARAEGISVLRDQVLAQTTDAMAMLFARAEIARGLLEEGDLDDAEREATKTIDDAGFLFQPHKATALAVLARIALARGDLPLALERAREGRKIGEQNGMDALTASIVRWIEAHAMRELGDPEAIDAARGAAERIEIIATALAELGLDRAWRTVPENAATLALRG
ncbi:serine/threonine-protein kinase PknK [Sandaracinus amylolyticus]|uniref:Adenylate cyclase n=1 Tax=Sandaracinus amylolyticus TaxID=927083 RepID=A0A0F6W8G7_9BACT|nr:protein kinase [Sandaracinus amylolyticus]AKF10162.1 Adenylate cyclase [Sandaracinus amylolyticus]